MCSVTLLMDGERLAGFYSLSPFALSMSQFPPEIAGKFPRNLLLPCWLVSKLAVDIYNSGGSNTEPSCSPTPCRKSKNSRPRRAATES